MVNLIPSHGNLNLECTLNNMVNADDSWNLDMFQVQILEEIIYRIVSILLLQSLAGLEKIAWLGTST